MEVTVGTAWQNSQTLLFLHEKRQKITWKVEVVSLLLKKKMCSKSVLWVAKAKEGGGRVLGVSFLFPYRSEIMLWEWLKLVKPPLVERSEKRSELALSWPTQKYGLFCGLTDEFDMLWYLVLKIMILPVRRYLMTPLYENVLKSGKLMLFDVPGESFSK